MRYDPVIDAATPETAGHSALMRFADSMFFIQSHPINAPTSYYIKARVNGISIRRKYV
jgi:hypothetical protein